MKNWKGSDAENVLYTTQDVLWCYEIKYNHTGFQETVSARRIRKPEKKKKKHVRNTSVAWDSSAASPYRFEETDLSYRNNTVVRDTGGDGPRSVTVDWSKRKDMTEMDMREHVRNVFEMLSAGFEKLTKENFRKRAMIKNPRLKKLEVDDLFDLMDSDGNEELSLEEFMECYDLYQQVMEASKMMSQQRRRDSISKARASKAAPIKIDYKKRKRLDEINESNEVHTAFDKLCGADGKITLKLFLHKIKSKTGHLKDREIRKIFKQLSNNKKYIDLKMFQKRYDHYLDKVLGRNQPDEF